MSSLQEKKRVLAIFAHADDELGCAGTLANYTDEGHEVTLAFLTKGENSSYVPGDAEEISKKRKIHTEKIEVLLGVKVRWLDFTDSRIEYTMDNAYKIAELIKEMRPHILITWSKFTRVGGGHPDHRNCADLVRDAISYARYKNPNSNFDPFRELIDFYIYVNNENAHLSTVYIDVTHQEKRIRDFIAIYKEAYGEWPVEDFKFGSLAYMGRMGGVRYAEAFHVVMSKQSASKLFK